MKQKYETPRAELILFNDMDVIVTSGRGGRRPWKTNMNSSCGSGGR